jgi:hypothetical protein
MRHVERATSSWSSAKTSTSMMPNLLEGLEDARPEAAEGWCVEVDLLNETLVDAYIVDVSHWNCGNSKKRVTQHFDCQIATTHHLREKVALERDHLQNPIRCQNLVRTPGRRLSRQLRGWLLKKKFSKTFFMKIGNF